MKIVVGSDHGGYDLKEALRRRLEEEGHEVQDVGCHGEPVDYPDIAVALCKVVTGGEAEFGILCCGTGIGISMAANKIKGAYAAVCHDIYSTQRSILSNDANILCMGALVIGQKTAEELVRLWLPLRFDPSSPSAAKVAQLRQLEEV